MWRSWWSGVWLTVHWHWQSWTTLESLLFKISSTKAETSSVRCVLIAESLCGLVTYLVVLAGVHSASDTLRTTPFYEEELGQHPKEQRLDCPLRSTFYPLNNPGAYFDYHPALQNAVRNCGIFSVAADYK